MYYLFNFILLHPWFVVGFVLIILYIVALLNRIIYLKKIYLLDLYNLELQGKSEIAGMRTKMIRDGTQRYSPKTADGIIDEVERVANERIQRRKLEYHHEKIASILTTLTGIAKK